MLALYHKIKQTKGDYPQICKQAGQMDRSRAGQIKPLTVCGVHLGEKGTGANRDLAWKQSDSEIIRRGESLL